MGYIEVTGDVTPTAIVADVAVEFDQMSFRPQLTEKHIVQGDTPVFNFTIQNAGLPFDLNGLSMSFAAKTSPTSFAPYVFNSSCNVNDPTNGRATIQLTANQTAIPGDLLAEIALWGSTVGQKLVALQFPLVIDPRIA